MVKKDGEPIAGAVCQMVKDTCRGYHMGVLDGREDLLKGGSNIALWWFVLLWGRAQGARHYNLGTCIPITANGVFTFKFHWGSRVHPDKERNYLMSFFGLNLPARLRRHLSGLGFLTEKNGSFYQVLLHEPAEPPDEKTLADRLHHLRECGIAGIMIISTDGGMRLIPSEAVKHDPTGRRYLAFS